MDRTIKIWNPQDGTLKKTLTGHTDAVWTLTTLLNGNLASGSFDKTIRIWNLNDGKLNITLAGHNDRVNALTTLPNGDLVSGSEDGTIRIWNPNDGTLKRIINTGYYTGYHKKFYSLSKLRNGDLVSGSFSEVYIWYNNGTIKKALYSGFNYIQALTTLGNGDLAFGSSDSSIRIWNSTDWTLKSIFYDYDLTTCSINGYRVRDINALTVLNNGDLVSASNFGTISIWNQNDWTLKKRIRAFQFDDSPSYCGSGVNALAILSNGNLASTWLNHIKIWNVGLL
jgi:WD40 repeat protein